MEFFFKTIFFQNISQISTLHFLGLIYMKNYSNLVKIFVLKLFEMVANETDCSSLEQKSVIKFLVIGKCKPWEIYRRMCDVYGEDCFSKKKFFTNGLNIVLPLGAWVEKTVHGVKTPRISDKEKVPGVAIGKLVNLAVILAFSSSLMLLGVFLVCRSTAPHL